MSTVTFTAKLRSGHRPRKPAPAPHAAPPAPSRRSDRAARMLALAYHLDRLIEDGVLRDYAHAAQVLGVSRARVTQIMDMLRLAAKAQEMILVDATTISERRLRRRSPDRFTSLRNPAPVSQSPAQMVHVVSVSPEESRCVPITRDHDQSK